MAAPQLTNWPSLPADDPWFDTLETFHLWTQVIGKLRLVNAVWINHSWSVPLYVAPRGLRTSLVPYAGDNPARHGEAFELTFDLVDHRLELTTSAGTHDGFDLEPMTVAEFYRRTMAMIADAELPATINNTPNEIADAIDFPDDTTHQTYDRDRIHTLWQALIQTDRVFTRFRADYWGKASPVHFFWGSFDLAVTRFSGRTAPPHPGGMPNFADDVAREAYSHEVTSCGFWPGNREAPPIFYAYAYPTPDGYAEATVKPAEAFWLAELGEFALPYAAVAAASDPDAMLLAFADSAHVAAADLLGWDRELLECHAPFGANWWRTRPAG
ncbi:MAG: DUF5996 family protein [Actinomycetota bacterium]